MLFKYGLHKNVLYSGLCKLGKGSQNGFAPYFLGDEKYTLIS
jgi:hypothetical protein